MLMTTQGLAVRVWNGTEIARRQADGFVNATAMCQANDKRWARYAESKRGQEYMQALAAEVRNPDFDLVQSQRGGEAGGGITWIHPSIAVDLARWISPEFAVWMDGWFLEQLQQPQAPTLTADDVQRICTETIERVMGTQQPRRTRQATLPSPINPERLAAVIPHCNPLTSSTILPLLGLSNTRANQMALSTALHAMGYRRHRPMLNGRRQWLYSADHPALLPAPTTPPAPLPTGIHIVAPSPRAAAQLWFDAVRLEVAGKLSRGLNPANRHDDTLRPSPYYSWRQSA